MHTCWSSSMSGDMKEKGHSSCAGTNVGLFTAFSPAEPALISHVLRRPFQGLASDIRSTDVIRSAGPTAERGLLGGTGGSTSPEEKQIFECRTSPGAYSDSVERKVSFNSRVQSLALTPSLRCDEPVWRSSPPVALLVRSLFLGPHSWVTYEGSCRHVTIAQLLLSYF